MVEIDNNSIESPISSYIEDQRESFDTVVELYLSIIKKYIYIKFLKFYLINLKMMVLGGWMMQNTFGYFWDMKVHFDLKQGMRKEKKRKGDND